MCCSRNALPPDRSKLRTPRNRVSELTSTICCAASPGSHKMVTSPVPALWAQAPLPTRGTPWTEELNHPFREKVHLGSIFGDWSGSGRMSRPHFLTTGLVRWSGHRGWWDGRSHTYVPTA